MNNTIIVIQVLLVIAFTANGFTQLLVPYPRYTKLPAQDWSTDFKPWHIKLIAILKLAAIAGIIAPLFLPGLTMFKPLAAVGLALVMAGAMATHLRREEYPNLVGNLVFLSLWLLVAYSALIGFAV